MEPEKTLNCRCCVHAFIIFHVVVVGKLFFSNQLWHLLFKKKTHHLMKNVLLGGLRPSDNI
jgi:D-alanyl-lipoteichoic acid acyltransferase DltB (MBOAT superfamily)